MILPASAEDRARVYRNVIRECAVSRENRRGQYRTLRQWYLNGSDTGAQARYNKLVEFVAFSSAYLYAPDSVKFGVVLPPHYGTDWIAECDAARDELHRLWHDSDAGIIFDQMVTWAHVYPSTVGKVIMSAGEPMLDMIADPADIGVRNEQANQWDTQEALVHYYYLSVDAFKRMVAAHPRAAHLREQADQTAMPGYEATSDTLPSAVQRTIILSQASPNMIGAVQGAGDFAVAIAQVTEPVIRMAELWIRDDAINDYRVAQHMADSEEILWDPPNPLIPGEHPFHPLSLCPTPGYLWGDAPLRGLLKMQSWREDKMRQLDDRDDKLIDPPIMFKGFTQITEEQADRFRAKGGNLATSNPTAEAQPFPPAPVAEPYAILDRIDTDFARQQGLPRAIQGMGEPGVRANDQADAAALASGPTQKRATYVKSALEGIATQMLRLRRRTYGETIKMQQGTTARDFLLAQMPGDIVARVWADSHSPLFAQKILAKAKLAHDAKAIDNEDFLEYLDLPLTDSKLKAKARKMEEAMAERQKTLMDAKVKETEAKAAKAQAGARKG